MATTYEPIATTTLGSAQATVTFSSIPATYTDLVLIVTGTVTSAASMYIRFNSDSGSNYSITRLSGNGTSAGSERTTNANSGTYGVWRTTNPQYALIQIQNYANATTNKTFLSRSYDDAGSVFAYVGLYRSTSAINRIDLISDTSYQTGCVVTLYGIKAA